MRKLAKRVLKSTGYKKVKIHLTSQENLCLKVVFTHEKSPTTLVRGSITLWDALNYLDNK